MGLFVKSMLSGKKNYETKVSSLKNCTSDSVESFVCVCICVCEKDRNRKRQEERIINEDVKNFSNMVGHGKSLEE